MVHLRTLYLYRPKGQRNKKCLKKGPATRSFEAPFFRAALFKSDSSDTNVVTEFEEPSLSNSKGMCKGVRRAMKTFNASFCTEFDLYSGA